MLACSAYVDLNPIRAGIADRPENSAFTSVQERIAELQEQERQPSLVNDPNQGATAATMPFAPEPWLCPFKDTATRRGFLDIELPDYLELLDWTGRQVCKGKRGAIPDHLAPILERLDINSQEWLVSSTQFGSIFYRVAGRVDHMAQKALELGQHWLRGSEASRSCFLT